MKVNIRWVFDIIDSYIGGLDRDYSQGEESKESYQAKVEVLQKLSVTLKSFIKDSNSL